MILYKYNYLRHLVPSLLYHFIWTMTAFSSFEFEYRKVASSRLSRLVTHFHIFRLFMKGNLDAYDLQTKWSKIE